MIALGNPYTDSCADFMAYTCTQKYGKWKYIIMSQKYFLCSFFCRLNNLSMMPSICLTSHDLCKCQFIQAGTLRETLWTLIQGEFALNFLQLDTSRPEKNGGHFTCDIFNMIFLNETVWNVTTISMILAQVIVPHWFMKWLGTDQVTSHYWAASIQRQALVG